VSEHDEREDYADGPWRKRRVPEKVIRLLGSAIWAVGLLQFCISVAGLVVAAILSIPGAGHKDEVDTFDFVAVGTYMIVGIAWNSVVMRAGAGIERLRGYRLAVLGSVMSAISVPFIYFGVFSFPLGVCSFALLLRSDVCARFAAVARGTIKEAMPHPD